MPNYIGKVQIGDNTEHILVGSTLYGVCATEATNAAKVVTLPDFNAFMHGITVQVRFQNGNSVTSNVTLKIGTTDPQLVVGNCVCEADDVISFTLSQVNDNTCWYANHSIKVEEGSTDGSIKIAGQSVTVHGLGTAAYQNSTAFATAAQGALADAAMPRSGGTFTGEVTMSENTTDSSPNLAIATKGYVLDKTAGLTGLTGAMHFKGSVSAEVITNPPADTYGNGDVVLGPNHKEYVYNNGIWIELGDEGSFLLQSAIRYVQSSSIFSSGSLPTLTPTQMTASQVTVTAGTPPSLSTSEITVPNITEAGTATRAQVQNGVLKIIPGTDTTLGNDISFQAVDTFSAGTTPSTVQSSTVTFNSADGWTNGTLPTFDDITLVAQAIQSGG